ncbi:MAG: hypothetical protein ACC726_16970, partial [Chloroflexota bacterium]
REATTIEPIPEYQVALFADTATSDEQVAYVVLVYDSPADAQIAAEVLPGRIGALDSVVFRQSLREMFEDRGVSEIAASVVSSTDGIGAATVLAFRAPLASSAQASGSGTDGASSLPYRRLITLVLRGDTSWLAAAPGE